VLTGHSRRQLPFVLLRRALRCVLTTLMNPDRASKLRA
jgi:hypothetical protein